MTHQPVELVRRRQADITLHVDDALVLQHFMGQLRGDTRRVPEGVPSGISTNLELALVVERQHLDGDELERHERRRREEQKATPARKASRIRPFPIRPAIARRYSRVAAPSGAWP